MIQAVLSTIGFSLAASVIGTGIFEAIPGPLFGVSAYSTTVSTSIFVASFLAGSALQIYSHYQNSPLKYPIVDLDPFTSSIITGLTMGTLATAFEFDPTTATLIGLTAFTYWNLDNLSPLFDGLAIGANYLIGSLIMDSNTSSL